VHGAILGSPSHLDNPTRADLSGRRREAAPTLISEATGCPPERLSRRPSGVVAGAAGLARVHLAVRSSDENCKIVARASDGHAYGRGQFG
jgi:hypothetical protein